MTRYKDYIAPFSDLKTEHVKDYREGVDAVLSFLDAEAAYQIRCLIEEGEI